MGSFPETSIDPNVPQCIPDLAFSRRSDCREGAKRYDKEKQ